MADQFTFSLLELSGTVLGLLGVVVAVIAYYMSRRRRVEQEVVAERIKQEVAEALKQVVHPAANLEVDEAIVGARRAIPPPALYVREILLENLRCFRDARVEFVATESGPARTLLIGDNAAGKSTLLRSIVLALSTESDAAALLAAWPGSLIREGAETASIRVVLADSAGKVYQIDKTLQRGPDGSETLRYTTRPATEFPWKAIFVCAYGTQRTSAATKSFDSYSTRDAASTLFDDQTSLQNPELVLLRQRPEVAKRLRRKLLDILLLDPAHNDIQQGSAGLRIQGPWGGPVPLRALSDGYRSTVQWLMDLFAWLVHAGRLELLDDEPDGILLIDEIEQHLHPRWQRYIIQRLSEQLPRIQIIATTHTPLVASGMADLPGATMIRLASQEGETLVSSIDPQELRGKRADQVLTEIFDLVTTRNPKSSEDMTRLVELQGTTNPSDQENREISELETRLAPTLRFGETKVERQVEQAVTVALKTILKETPHATVSLEAKRQLRELFRSDDTPT